MYGIYFDTDKSEVKPSRGRLDEIAKLLRSGRRSNCNVVGHTDMTASLAHNRALDRRLAPALS